MTKCYALLLPLWAHSLADWLEYQITLGRECAQRRRKNELFRNGVKSGLIATDEQFNDEARKVVK
jgi:hypothetical protein